MRKLLVVFVMVLTAGCGGGDTEPPTTDAEPPTITIMPTTSTSVTTTVVTTTSTTSTTTTTSPPATISSRRTWDSLDRLYNTMNPAKQIVFCEGVGIFGLSEYAAALVEQSSGQFDQRDVEGWLGLKC